MDRRQLLQRTIAVGSVTMFSGCQLAGDSDDDADTQSLTTTATESPTASDDPTESPTASDNPTESPTVSDDPTESPTAPDDPTESPSPSPTETPVDVETVSDDELPERVLPAFDALGETIHTTQTDTNEADLLVTTLQGIVNRNEPRIYIPRGSGWRTSVDFSVDSVGMWELVETYADEVDGVVAYDPDAPDTINVATTIAGVENAVVASPDHASTLRDDFGLSVLEDLGASDVEFSDRVTAYEWLVDNYHDQTSDEVMISLPPGVRDIRDYAVATKAMVLYLDTSFSPEREIFLEVAENLSSTSACLGWFIDEIDGVQACSESEVFVGAADFFRSGTFWSGTSPDSAKEIRTHLPDPPEPPELENKVYVTITLSEGDNLQYCQAKMKQHWEQSARGSVPMNWSVSPMLLDIAPAILEYYYKTATENDHFMCGPSGIGYAYPKDWPADSLNEYIGVSGKYMDELDIETIYMLNRLGINSTLSDRAARLYELEVDPTGIALGWDGPVTTFRGEEMVVSHGIVGLGGATDADDITEAIQLTAANRDRPVFLSVGVSSWDVGPAKIKAVVENLGSDFEVVRADVFFKLAKQALQSGS